MRFTLPITAILCGITFNMIVESRTDSKPSLTPQNLTIGIGENAVFVCETALLNRQQLRWHVDGRRVGASRHSRLFASSNRLYLLGAKPRDAGDYTCTVAKWSSNISKLRVINRPVVREEGRRIPVKASPGENVELTAHVKNLDEVDHVVWSHGQTKLSPNKKFNFIVKSKEVRLMVRNVRGRDSGVYRLDVANPQGSVQVFYALTVEVTGRPGSPDNLSYVVATNCSDKCLTFYWNASRGVPRPTTYHLWISTVSQNDGTIFRNVSAPFLSARWCDREEGLKYRIYVFASNEHGSGSASPKITARWTREHCPAFEGRTERTTKPPTSHPL